MTGLLAFVAGGGGLLIVHTGVSLQRRPELSPMLGAYYEGHGPYGRLAYRATDVPHPITEGIGEFEMDEEPYRFELYPIANASVLMEYRDEEGTWPAVWAHSYGLGRVAYLQPGHHLPSFGAEPVRRLLANAARWCGSKS
jgi:type 1 glutamine amidotransferase